MKKLLHLIAISFFSVSIFQSTLKNSGSCILVVCFVGNFFDGFPCIPNIVCVFC